MSRQKIVWSVLFSLIVLLLCGCEKDDGEIAGSIYGVITDADNGEPISGVTITLNPGGISATTGNDGRFEFLGLPPSQYTILAQKENYQTNSKIITITADKTVSGDMRLLRGTSKIKLSTNALKFDGSTNFRTLTIMNVSSSESVSWSIHNDNDWLVISPTSGTVEAGKSNDIIVSILSDIVSEDIDGAILISASGESFAVSVSVVGAENNNNNNNGGSSGANITAGLIAYYTFDNENAHDFTENKFHGSIINSPDFTSATASGKGKAVYLNGIKEQYINIPYNLLKGQTSYTISMWVKDINNGVVFTASGSYEEACYPRLVANLDNKFKYNYNCIWVDVPITFNFSYSYSGIQDGEWHMLTVTCKVVSENKTTIELYIDGVLVDTVNESYVAQHNHTSKIQIGGNLDGEYSYYNSMKVDNIRFYSKGLDAKTVSAIYEYEK